MRARNGGSTGGWERNRLPDCGIRRLSGRDPSQDRFSDLKRGEARFAWNANRFPREDSVYKVPLLVEDRVAILHDGRFQRQEFGKERFPQALQLGW